jgi:KDO2-lipid IV(A) lauroyltransferase
LLTAPASLAGVRQLLRALKAGHAVGLLPDQVPPANMGIWAPFFGQSAYTMTLAARLAQQSGALIVLAWGERLSLGRGYVVHVEPMLEALLSELPQAVHQINQAMEFLILRNPGQYLWGYARYKSPREEL